MRGVSFLIFLCDLYDADYMGYTARYLLQRIIKHQKIGNWVTHFGSPWGHKPPKESQFRILLKCQTKFDFQLY